MYCPLNATIYLAVDINSGQVSCVRWDIYILALACVLLSCIIRPLYFKSL